MSLLLTIVTVSSFDHTRLTRTLRSTRILPDGVEHVFVVPEQDLESRELISREKEQGKHLKVAFDTNSGVYGAMNLGASVASGKYVIFWNSGDTLNSLSDFELFLSELRNSKLSWAVASGKLELGTIHEVTPADLRNFRDQKPGSYVSHQVIACRRDVMFDLGLFDLSFKVAADTKMIQALSGRDVPMFSSAVIVEIETPKFSAIHHRLSRLETGKLALSDVLLRAHFRPIINVLKREINFLINSR
jgi:putative colanic acid biosynthesis glycosyltransferase